ncbi:androgen-binding protein homolog [Trichosurus vulpecula]|uniref:androgen-binding protein homolog n=1 Tax=Trichosurus vulpecula TaxID=9337 RepID=UPI00186AF8CA|nr:androgen-binding protein homolog [Trichosurus vulpecula]
MKITVATFSLLLVLALCSQYAEGCTGFYGTFGVLLLGDPSLLALNLEKYGPTEAETQALIKVQECYAESPVKTSLIDALFLVLISQTSHSPREHKSSWMAVGRRSEEIPRTYTLRCSASAKRVTVIQLALLLALNTV